MDRCYGKKYNKIIYRRVQRLMNMTIAKIYRRISYEALCILTGTIPKEINAEETATLYRITRDRQNYQLDHEAESKTPENSVSASKTKKRNALLRYSNMEAKTRTESDRESFYIYIYKGVSKSFDPSFIDRQPMAVRE